MLVFTRNQSLNDATDAAHGFFGRGGMNREMAKIKAAREALISMGVDGKWNRRTGHKRRIAAIPPPLFVYLSQTAPELFRNPQMLRTYLKNNPGLLLVPKENI